MFLSKLILNPRDRQVRIDLARPYEMHRTLWKAFPDGDPGRILYRVDAGRQGQSLLLLVQSDYAPNWSRLPASYVQGGPDCKPVDWSLANEQRLRFRLRANPTKRVATKNERLGGVMLGKRVGITTETEQIRWLLRKGEVGGFRVPGAWVPARDAETDAPIEVPNFRLDVIDEGRVFNSKPDHGGSFLAVRFEGVLIVTDPIAFRKTLDDGVGSAKSFGFGLLSVAPA